jgi:hypothetical protein
MSDWADQVLAFPYTNSVAQQPTLQVVRQDHEKLGYNRSVIKTIPAGQRGPARNLRSC